MTEYGVQTNNLFDMLIAADETLKAAAKAKPKPKPKPKKKVTQSATSQPKPAPKKKVYTTDVPAVCPPTQRIPKIFEAKEKAEEKNATATPAATADDATKKAGNAAATQTPSQQGGSATGGKGGRAGQRGQGKRGPKSDKGKTDAAATATETTVAEAPSEEQAPAPKKKGTGPREKGDRKPVGGFTRNREFDRRSGTGRPANENKKEGAGAGNWGKPADSQLKATDDLKEELKAEDKAPAAGETEQKKKKKKKKKAKGEQEEEEKEKKEEIPDEQLKLFDDFVKTQKKPKVALPAPRKVGEADVEGTKVERETEQVFFLAPPKGEKGKKKETPKPDQKPSKSKLKKLRERKKREEEKKKLEKDNIQTLFDFTAKKEESFAPRGRREGRGNRFPKEDRGLPRGNAPRKFGVGTDAPQFDDSSFPALQVGPASVTASSE